MRKLPFRLRGAPVRLDAPGDNWPVYPVHRPRGWRMSQHLSSLFLRKGRRRESPVR